MLEVRIPVAVTALGCQRDLEFDCQEALISAVFLPSAQ